jgi:hypothetical protein
MACSGGGSSSSGLFHGSTSGSGSVTVCVGSSSSTAGATSTHTTTKTVTVAPKNASPKKASTAAPVKQVAKPAPVPIAQKVSCPSATQLASMPKSADAAERWVQSICGGAPKAQTVSKPTPKPSPTPKPKPKTKTITETIVTKIPGGFSSSFDAVTFHPNSLTISYYPNSVLAIGQLAKFVSNPSLHYSSQAVLGRQAEVEFTPNLLSWVFSDGLQRVGNQTERSFESQGSYLVQARISYLVRYRLLGETSWQQVPGQISASSNVLEVPVGAKFLAGGSSTGWTVTRSTPTAEPPSTRLPEAPATSMISFTRTCPT